MADEDTTEETTEEAEETVEPDAEETGPDEETETPAKPDTVSRTALDKAIKERQAAKAKLREREKELDELKRSTEGDAERTARETREQVQAELEKRYKPILVEKTARADLIAAGVKPDKVARMVRLMSLDEIEVGDDGEVTGLDDQIEELKSDYPELFGTVDAAKPERRGSRAADGADKKPETRKTRIEDRLVAQLRGSR